MTVFDPMPSDRQTDIGLLILRLALGAVFLVHGGQKLFMMGAAGSARMLDNMGIPGASLLGPLLMIVEPLAGAGILLGLLTRVAGLAIAVDMLSAILLVHIPHGFFVPRGIEFPMMLVASALTLMVMGAGAYSLDSAIARGRTHAAAVT